MVCGKRVCIVTRGRGKWNCREKGCIVERGRGSRIVEGGGGSGIVGRGHIFRPQLSPNGLSYI